MDLVARHPVMIHRRTIRMKHGAAGVNFVVIDIIWRHVFTGIGRNLSGISGGIGLTVVRLRAAIGGQRGAAG